MRDEIVEPAGSHEPTAHPKTPRKAALSGWIGSTLEFYEFFIYAQAAALVFPLIMFDQSNPTVAIVASFATYGVGYVARPVGAFVFGHLGDTLGRKRIMLFCLILTGVATFLVAFLPTYQQVGILAPILLLLLRLVQGFVLGGESSGAGTMILEHAPFGRRGFYTSFQIQGIQFGQILAAAVFLPLSANLPQEDFLSWGWRIPFALSALVVIAGIIIRRKLPETPAFVEEAEEGHVPQAPIKQVFRENGLDMFRVVCMALMNAVPTAVVVFGATYATNKAYGIGFSPTMYLWISLTGNIVAVCLIPFVAALSDRIGRRPVFIVGALGSTALGYAYLSAVTSKNATLAFVLAILMWGIVYQGYNAVAPCFWPEQFPTKTRMTGLAVSSNIGIMFTATLPLIYAAVAPPGSNVPLIVGGITFAIGIIAATAVFFSRETYRTHLDDLGRNGAPEVPLEEYKRIRARATASG